MLHILDYGIKTRMRVERPEELASFAIGFMCMFGRQAEDLVILDDETGEETPYLKFSK